MGRGRNRRCHADWGAHVNALDCRSFAPFLGGLTDRWGRRVGGLIFLLFGTLSLTIAAMRGCFFTHCLSLVFFICATGSKSSAGRRSGCSRFSGIASRDGGGLGCMPWSIVGWMMPQWALPTGWFSKRGALLRIGGREDSADNANLADRL